MESKSQRLFALDGARGLIIILMALDHANYFIAQKHPSGEHWGGGFPTYDNTLAFLTRLVTHPAAPGFSFLMGVGMYLFAHSRRLKGWSEWAIIRHFLIRGAFLIALQLLVINQAWKLGAVPFPDIYIGVLFALGGGMIIGSFLLRLKSSYLLGLTILLLIGTELFHPDPSQWGQTFDQTAALLLLYSGGDVSFWSNYPILPWLELITFGMFFGSLVTTDSQKALRSTLVLGSVLLLTFVFIRYLDGFGNIRPRPGNSWIDFLNVVKYPPALTFTFLTMGINLIVLGLLARAGDSMQRWLKPLTIFGQTPMFFYILHLFLYAFMGLWLAPGGTSLPAMYPYWLLGLVILTPLCIWYGSFKHRQPANSLFRFL